MCHRSIYASLDRDRTARNDTPDTVIKIVKHVESRPTSCSTMASVRLEPSVLDGATVGIEEFIDNCTGRLVVRGCIKSKCVVVTLSSTDWRSGCDGSN